MGRIEIYVPCVQNFIKIAQLFHHLFTLISIVVQCFTLIYKLEIIKFVRPEKNCTPGKKNMYINVLPLLISTACLETVLFLKLIKGPFSGS